jgi:predicted nucleotidyltransferase
MFEKSNTMHFHGLPERLLGSRARMAVLTALLRSPDAQWTGRELARATRVSPSQVMAALRTFEEEGMCYERRVGRAGVWSLSKSSLLVQKLASLARLDEDAQERLTSSLTRALRGCGALEAYVFGSVAAGREEARSDVDLLVLLSDRKRLEALKRKLDAMRPKFEAEFGSFLSPMLLVNGQVKSRSARRILREARANGVHLEVR